MKTFSARKEDIRRNWYVVDARGRVLGRLASQVAQLLAGKGKVIYTPHVDTGDHVIVINAADVRLTGKKLEQKRHYSYSGYPGGLKSEDYETMIEKHPERVIRVAVKGMLPHTKLGSAMLTKRKIYRGGEHPHEAQQPRLLELQ